MRTITVKRGILYICALLIVGVGQLSAQDDLPPNAVPGKCYAKCQTADVYETVTERIMTKPESKKIEVVPAVYETVTEQVLDQAESKRLEVTPAVYETITERVLGKEGYTKKIPVPAVYETVTERVLDVAESYRIETSPAVYETVTEQILVSPATTRWEKGKADPNCLSANPDDCNVMCLVEVPAEYRTITKRVLKTAESSKQITIPASYKTITKKVVKTPATVREVDVPAEYKTVTKRVLKTPEVVKEISIPAKYKTITKKVVKTPASTREITIPAEYRTITKRVLKSKGSFGGWEEVVCANDLTYDRIRALQTALKAKGYDIGSAGVDGVMGRDTRAALTKYQQDNGLPLGNLNIKTMESLGIR